MIQFQNMGFDRFDEIIDFRTAGMIPPNRLIFGYGAVEQIGQETAKLAKGKVLIVSDGVIEKLGLLDRVAGSMSEAGFDVETFTDVEPEPHIETAESLYEFGAARDFAAVAGVGGGSVMDIAKLSAQCLASQQSPRLYMERKVEPEKRGLPLLLAPTTAGTGSEVSMNLVVAVGEDKLFLSNPYFYCDIGIVDPGLTLSMPPMITANTGIDALSHAVEGMLHKKSSPFGDVLCLASIEMIGANLRKAVADGQDRQARYYMSLAAVLGMMGMMFSGALYAHSAAYAISKYKPVPHGLGCGIPLPYTMAFNLPVCVPKLARMAAAFGEPTWMLSELDAAHLAVETTVRLNQEVGLPITLEELGGVQEEDLDDMADMMIEKWPRPTNPRPMGQEEARRFFRDMWIGEY